MKLVTCRIRWSLKLPLHLLGNVATTSQQKEQPGIQVSTTWNPGLNNKNQQTAIRHFHGQTRSDSQWNHG